MQSKKTTFRSFMVKSGKKRHGFTMAELIVVIVIIAIVATAGIVAAVGFMSKSKFDQNSQNAITVYQTSQTAISQKVANGSIEAWVLSNFSASDFSDEYFLNTEEGKGLLNEPNKAVHRAVHLTTNPGNTSSPLYQLLNGYFYDNTVFAGTLSVEFDISAVKQNDGSVGYSATVLSAFYSKENKANDGWDSTCLGNSQDGLPQRDFTYRHDTSHVGYYYGSQESIDGTLPNGGGPVPVALPGLQNAAIDFFMRNGETLDLTWAMFDNTSHDANLKITLKNEDDSTAAPVVLEISEKELLYSWQDSSKPKSLDYANVIGNLPSFPADTFKSEQKVVYEEIKYAAVDGTLKTMNITKTSKEALAVVKCNGTSYQIPLVVTFVNGDTRDGYPATGYLTYTLCLDCLMTRSDYESGSDTDLFSISRFFGNNPANISASISGTVSGSNIESTNATRAIDDPIAFEAVRMSASNPTYCYVLGSEKRGTKDTDTKCVVNTLFGDGIYGSVPGTEYNSISKTASATISAFRHLSNIRLVEDDVSADFTIVRNLNWYEKLTGNNISYYVSDVQVFKRYGNASSSEIGFRASEGYSGSDISHSPASGNNLKVVSFPALPVIDSNKTLSAMDSCSINCVQLRKMSFDNSDTGRGLICENRGKITNIQTNNLNLVLNSEIRNGTSSDYSTITIVPADITAATGAEKDIAVGGLIGLNSGEVGSSDGIIRMSNCIVMTGYYWTNNNIDKYTKGTGGVVGANIGSSALINGELEINGDFVVSGYTHVGGIVGFNNSSFDTKLIVNGTTAPSSEFSNLKVGTAKASCIIFGLDYVGGAIGETDASSVGDVSVKYSDADDKIGIVRGGSYVGGAIGYNKTSVIDSVSVEGCVDIFGSGNWVGGSVGFNEARITNVKVKYTGSSFVKGQDNVSGAIGLNNADITDGISVEYTKDLSVIGTGDYVGGAIGQITSGNIKSVSVISASENAGALKITGTSYVGGAIGYNKVSVIETVSVNCSTVITGSGDNIGGAIGCVESTASITDSVSVEGNFNISTTGEYAGGAIGINKSNNVASVTVKADISIRSEDDYVGGAIGYNEASIADNVSVEGSISISTTGDNVGGAIGKNAASVNRVVVKINNNSTITGNDYVGGAIGCNNAIVVNGISVSYDKALKLSGSQYIGGAIGLTDAETVGDIIVTGSGDGIIEIDGSTYLGGAIGHNNSSLNSVSVDGKLDIRGDLDYVGGVIGRNDKSILVALTASVSGSVVSDSGDYVGGAIGYNYAVVKSVSATILSGSTIEGNVCTAGAIGYNGAGITDGVTAVIESSSTVEGSTYVGGAIGQSAVSLPVVESSVYGVVKGSGNYIGGAIACTDASITKIEVNISGSIIGDPDNSDFVGGAIGRHKSSVESLSVTYTGTGEVSGHDNVGGKIGRLDGTVPSNSIDVDLNDGRTVKGNSYVGGIIGYNNVPLTTVSATINGTISGSGSGIGGAIGYNTKPITTISSSLTGSVEGTGENVGGVIGYNNNAIINKVSIVTTGSSSLIQGSSYVGGLIGYLYKSTINEPLSASFSSGTSIKGSSDGSCVGGLCGYITNDGNGNISVNKAVNLTLNGVTVEGGTKVGGAFGYLYKTKINNSITITATDSSIKSESTDISDLGGAIGLTDEVTHNGNLTVTLNNSSIIGKGKYVGGIIGHNRSTQKNITITINNDSFVQGRTTVGGAIGWAEGVKNDRGKMDSETVVINTAQAIRGVGTMGGAFGRIGLVPIGTKDESWPYIGNTTLEINTGVPFKQIEGSKEDQGYIGGAIGNISNANNIIKITLKGTGGSFNLADVGLNDNAVSKSILVSGKGPSVGGLVGNSGDEYSGQGVRFRDVDVSKSPSLYVVSEDGSDGIGGWIGSSKGFFRNGDSGTVTYTVNNVKLVYSNGGSGVGAFCGIIDNSVNISKAENYAKVTVNLSGTTVHGGSNVGGAVGYMYAKYNGSLTVNADSATSIYGSGNNVGGAIGYCNKLAPKNNNDDLIVTLNSTYVTGGNNVGGAIGYMNGTTQKGNLSVTLNKAQITGGDNVGGAIGQMNKSNISKNLTVNIASGTSITGSSSVGGVCGYIINKDNNTISISNVVTLSLTGITISGENNIGGVYGTVEKTKFDKIINVSVADSSITGSGSNIGGAIGKIVECNITEGLGSNSSPIQISSNTKISGNSNVGGAVGYITSGTISKGIFATINNSTVTGTLENAGGTVGYISNGTINGGIRATLNTANISSVSKTGGSVGSISGGTINGGVNVTTDKSNISGGDKVGGVVGSVTGGTLNDGINVSLGNSKVSASDEYTGGAVGYISNGTINGGINVTTDGTSISGDNKVGGAIGSVAGGTLGGAIDVTLKNSLVTGESELGGGIGSVEGATLKSNISVALNKASVGDANEPNGTNVGGAIGLMNGGSFEGEISLSLDDTSALYADTAVGVAIGKLNGGTITNTINVTLDHFTISASSGAGGAIGVMSDGTIKGAINVTLKNNTQIKGTTEIGGAIGSITKGTVSGEIVVNADDSHIFGESKVGGSVGSVTGGQISGGINVTLNTSYVTGVSEIGGGIGLVDGSENSLIIKNGIKVVLSEQSYIGDIKNDGGEGYSCIDVGGAVGYLTNNKDNSNPIQNGPVRVEIDDTSMIFAGGENGGTEYGVGGVFGRLGSVNAGSKPELVTWNDKNNNTPYLSLYSASPETSVYSASSPVGGLVGHMISGKIWRSYSTAVVSGTDYVGGFVGYMESGEIDTSYVSAHTVDGQYEVGSENVVGRNYVGGFIGYIDDKVTYIHQCYSLASVRGLNYIGGFFGYLKSDRTDILCSTYCTGLVSWDEPDAPADPNDPLVIYYLGAYGGYVESASGTGIFKSSNVHAERNDVNKVLEASNIGMTRVGGWSNSTVIEIDDNRLCFSPYSDEEWGYKYIRVRQYSSYNAFPFDESLHEYANNFPYRTFISYSLGGEAYFGEHVGDWPIYGESKLKTLDSSNTQVTVNGTVAFRYGESGGFVLPKSALTVVYTDPVSGEVHTLAQNEYQVMFENNSHAGEHAICKILGLPTGGYNGEVDCEYTITPVDLSSNAVSVVIGGGTAEYAYTGEKITPAVTVIYHNSTTNKDVTIPSTEYSVSYGENTEVGASTGTITITAKDGADCAGDITVNFSIIPADLTNAVIELEHDSYTYTGEVIEPMVVKVTVDGNVVPDTAYDVSYENNTEIGSEAKVVVTAKDTETNYIGSTNVEFEIVPISIGEDDVVVDPTDYTYTGSDITPAVKVVVNGETLDPDNDYELSYPDEQNRVECATGLIVTITGKGNYTGTIDKTFNIIQANSGGDEGANNDATGDASETATPMPDGNPENAANGNAPETDPSPENPDAVPPESNDPVAPENQNDPNDPSDPNDSNDSTDSNGPNDPTDPNESGDP